MLAFVLQANTVPSEVQTAVEELRGVLRRGVRVLVDKDGTMAQIAALLIPGEFATCTAIDGVPGIW